MARSWEARYDVCDVPLEVSKACNKTDRRLAYDLIWDNRRRYGYVCGRRQFRYRGNSWETICTTVKGKLSNVTELYEAVSCSKANGAAGSTNKPYSTTAARQMGGAIRTANMRKSAEKNMNPADRKKYDELSKKVAEARKKLKEAKIRRAKSGSNAAKKALAKARKWLNLRKQMKSLCRKLRRLLQRN
ncbi:hypothetical protein BC829DRAFT_221282 [Chytridium lagenaria]|nr:hypothetical protein BC829DRAFT_221282 [Chytridium lagenaria]